MRVIVMGGSLGGLTAALLLRELGHDVRVFERSVAPLEGRGAGIVLHPATIRYLVERAGRSVAELGVASDTLRYLDRSGRIAHEQECHLRFASFYSLYGDLLACLGESAHRLGAEVKTFSQGSDHVSVTLVDGSTHECDLLVCADGIGSAARRRLLPDSTPRFSGYVAWRGTTRPSDLSARTVAQLEGAITYTVLPDGHVLTYPIPPLDDARADGHLTNWLWYRNVPDEAALADLTTDNEGRLRELSVPPGAVQERHIKALLADAREVLPAPLVETIGASSPDPFIQVIVDVEVPRMVFGRVCLMGDAAFGLRPHVAAGTAKAAEDAWQLADALGQCSSQDVAGRLAEWETRQLTLGRSLLARARRAGERAQFEGAWEVGEPLPFGLYEAGDSEIRQAVQSPAELPAR